MSDSYEPVVSMSYCLVNVFSMSNKTLSINISLCMDGLERLSGASVDGLRKYFNPIQSTFVNIYIFCNTASFEKVTFL